MELSTLEVDRIADDKEVLIPSTAADYMPANDAGDEQHVVNGDTDGEYSLLLSVTLPVIPVGLDPPVPS